MDSFWLKQTADKPLFEDLLWSRPENRKSAGKLLIIGGNLHGFAAVQQAYLVADQSGAGVIRVLLPEALRKTVGNSLEAAEYAASTTVSGSFSKDALGEWLIQSQWADCVLIAGDLGRNSETAILLESFVQKYHGPLIITKDAADYFIAKPELIAYRSSTTLVISLSQLQKFGTALKNETPFLLSMGLVLLVQALHNFTSKYPLTVVTKELDQVVVGHKARISSTKLAADEDIWRVNVAAKVSVWQMQNLNKTFEATTTALVQ